MQRRIGKCVYHLEARATTFIDFLARKTHSWIDDVKYLLLVEFCQILIFLFGRMQRGRSPSLEFFKLVVYVKDKSWKCQRPGWSSLLTDLPEKHVLGRGYWVLVFCKFSSNSKQWMQRNKKCLNQSEAIVASMNLVEDAECLIFDKFCLNPCSIFK